MIRKLLVLVLLAVAATAAVAAAQSREEVRQLKRELDAPLEAKPAEQRPITPP
jgi:hypothetical protein